jgi:hypothetical protein
MSWKPFVFPVLASTTKQRIKGNMRFKHATAERPRDKDSKSVVIGAPTGSVKELVA